MVAYIASQTIIYVIHAIHGIKNNFRKVSYVLQIDAKIFAD